MQGEDIGTPLSDSAKSEFAQKVRFLLTRGHRVWIRAVWGHKDDGARHTVTGRVYFLDPDDPVSSELKARWDDEPDVAYGFPFPDIHYFSIEIAKVQARMPGGEHVENPVNSLARVPASDPKDFSPVIPKTWGPWIEADDEFKPRELVRELRDTPELGIRFNPPPMRERLFQLLVKWIYAARQLQDWTTGYFYEIATGLIEELRNHYWAAAGAPVERVQQRLHQVSTPEDAYGKVMLEEQLKQTRINRRQGQPPLCFNCRAPGHVRANCPQLRQPVFSRGVASGAAVGQQMNRRGERRAAF